MFATHPNIRTFCPSVIVLHENAFQQKRERMIKGEKITRATFISAPLKAQQEESGYVCQIPEKDTIDRRQGGEGEAAEGMKRRRGPSCFILPRRYSK